MPAPESALDRMSKYQPLGRLGRPAAIAFLRGTDPSFTNGTTWPADEACRLGFGTRERRASRAPLGSVVNSARESHIFPIGLLIGSKK